MKFARLGPVGEEVPVLVLDDEVRSLAGITTDIDADFWAGDGPARAAAALEAVPGPCDVAGRFGGREPAQEQGISRRPGGARLS